MSEEPKDLKKSLSKEEIKAIEDGISNAEKTLVSEETQSVIAKAKEEAKQEALKEVEVQKELEKRDKELQELKQKMQEQEKAASEQLQNLKKSVDDMKGSQAIVNADDPFTKQSSQGSSVDNWSEEKINDVEQDSARAFFGNDYDER